MTADLLIYGFAAVAGFVLGWRRRGRWDARRNG